MHILYAVVAGLVAGLTLGYLYGSRAKAALEKELNSLRSSVAQTIKPKA